MESHLMGSETFCGLSKEHRQIQDLVRRVAREKVAPRADAIDTDAEYPQDMFDLLRELGLFTLPFPEQYGGTGSMLGACVAIEDTEAGLASARAAGLRTVGIDPSGEPGGLIGADQTLQSLTDLSLDRLHRWWP